MTAESNTKFMETAISQNIPFLGVNYTHIYCNNIYLDRGSLNVLYIIFWDMVYIVYEQCEPPATAKGSCHMSCDVWLAERGVG